MWSFLSDIAANPMPVVFGAVAGAAFVAGFYGIREWPRIRYRRQRAKRIAQGDLTALSEPEETEEYLPHAPDRG